MSADDQTQKLTGATVRFGKLKELRLSSLYCPDHTVAAILAQCTQLRALVRPRVPEPPRAARLPVAYVACRVVRCLVPCAACCEEISKSQIIGSCLRRDWLNATPALIAGPLVLFVAAAYMWYRGCGTYFTVPELATFRFVTVGCRPSI